MNIANTMVVSHVNKEGWVSMSSCRTDNCLNLGFENLKNAMVSIFFLLIVVCSQAIFANEKVGGYQIGAEDVLAISVWKEEDLSHDVLVRPDGKFTFPLVGDVMALGKEPETIRDEIASKLNRFIPDPVVTVVVKKIASYKVYVLGQIKKPGQYSVGRYLDVMQCLALAGGLTPFAVEDKIFIMRRTNGIENIILFDYSQVKRGRKLTQNIILKSGDVIIVP